MIRQLCRRFLTWAGFESDSFLQVSSIPLERCVACRDCRMVTESAGTVCNVCGSHSIYAVSIMDERDSVKMVENPLKNPMVQNKKGKS